MSVANPTAEAPILVRKYGGSSLASVQRIKTVAQDIRAARDRGYRMVVVVSAMGGTTDELSALAHEVHSHPPRRELDMLLSVGERITMSLLSMALAAENCPAISFTGSQCGIITDTSHSDARILEVRADRVREALARGHVVVVAGYQGVSLEKEITTLGRGGSDTTAVALAAALGAVRCEILKDVDGVLSADPARVDHPHQHQCLTWDEMRDVAESGCGVVHIRAVEYAANFGVPLVVRSSFHDGPGTTIGTVCPDELLPIAGAVAPTAAATGDLDPAAVTPPTQTSGSAADRESRYRPLVLHVVERVTRIRLQTDDDTLGQRWRDLLLSQLDPVLTVTEWLDFGEGFRWEGLTRQQNLAPLKAMLAAEPGWTAAGWQEDLSCLSLTGGRPDSWLEVQRQVADLMERLGTQNWRLRADGSALRILLAGEVSPTLVQELHRALLAP